MFVSNTDHLPSPGVSFSTRSHVSTAFHNQLVELMRFSGDAFGGVAASSRSPSSTSPYHPRKTCILRQGPYTPE